MTPLERVDQILKERNMSRRQLAQLARIPPSTLQSAMTRKDNVSILLLEQISNALEIPVVSLLDPDPEMTDLLLEVESGLDDVDGYNFLSFEEKQHLKSMVRRNARSIRAKMLSKSLREIDPQSIVAELIAGEVCKLNEKGQQVAVERIKELTKIPEYRKE